MDLCVFQETWTNFLSLQIRLDRNIIYDKEDLYAKDHFIQLCYSVWFFLRLQVRALLPMLCLYERIYFGIKTNKFFLFSD